MRLISIILFNTFICVAASSQYSPSSKSKSRPFNSSSGYVNINELHYGYGLFTTTGPYEDQYYGFSTSHGYQLSNSGLQRNTSFLILASAGFYIYNGGSLIPVSIDFRYIWNKRNISPFIYYNSGLLVNYDEFIDGTKLFLNSGAGIKLKFSRVLAASVSIGLQVQMGTESSRESFGALKAGVVYTPE